MWAKVAEDLQVPWGSAEIMHWDLDENDMARSADVIIFSVTACRLHYQNYLERRTPWDEEKMKKLKRLYDR